ncbi:MAG: hypothetical protein ABC596_06910 [Candidatus Methanosuratincola petrocarbonis]
MQTRRLLPVAIFLLLVATGTAAYVYFSFKANVEVFAGEVDVSPGSFSVSVAAGGHYVKTITVKNYGGEKEIYFDEVVEGPSNAIDVSYHLPDGTSITSSNRLKLPAGSPESPSEVEINVHIDIDDDAEPGEYVIYVAARS